MKKIIVIGLLGPILDLGKRANRWERWRPSVAICQHENLLVERFDLLYQKRYKSLCEYIARDIRLVSPETKVVPHEVTFSDPWDFEEVYGELHDFTKRYTFNPDKEDYLVHITTGTHVAQICLFLLTETGYFPAKLLQTSPPAKKRDGNINGDFRIIDLDLSKYDHIAMRFQQEFNDDISLLKSGIQTRNKAFNKLIERIEHVAVHSNDPILLMGPTGAGKSHLARRIYDLKKSKRQISGSFVEVNCATLRGDGAMSSLFGHKKGSFTGATQDRQGLLKAANQGILFLDEIGELGIDEQSMLLRAIEEKRFLPVGSDTESESDFQLLCGTNKVLQESVSIGKFRDDLLARINLWSFHLPGLNQRVEDIEPNLDYELDRFAEQNKMRVTFNKEARKRFLSFACSIHATWSGNFRDLNGAVKRMATLAHGGRITLDVVQEEIERLQQHWQPSSPKQNQGFLIEILGEEKISELDKFDKVALEEILKICQRSNSLSDAGRKLFSMSRQNKKIANDADRLRKYLAKFDITWKNIQSLQ